MRRHKKGMRAAAVCFAAVFCLTGCGTGSEAVKQGMQAIKDLDYQSALEYFTAAGENGSDERSALRGMGIAYMGLTDYAQASACFEEALKKSDGLVRPIDYDINYYLAAAYTKNGQLQEAEAVYNAILGLEAEAEDALFLRGNVRLGLDDYEGAKADFDKVIAMDGKNFDRLLQIYQVLDNYGYGEAGRFYLESAMTAGESGMTAYDKGRIHYYLGEYEKAYLALEEAKEKGGAEASLYLGKAYEATGDYNYASNVYTSYLEKDPANPQICNQLGLCEMSKGDYAKALSAFQTGKQSEDTGLLQTLSFNEIVAYEHLGEFQKAAELARAYLQTYPDDAQAQREYGFLSSR